MGIIIYILIFMNVLTFCAYGIDKYKAKKGKWRISEKALLLMGLCFGSIGQLAGMKAFRHKTQKWYFRVSGAVFLILHILVLYMYCAK